MSGKKYPNALQPGYMLHWYRIEKVLGQGAFGITYLAHDINLDRPVAIKEYMPGQLCTRAGDQTIQPLSDEHGDDFKWGLTRFINEARTLTKFEHPNLVRVFNVFEMNNTAYMVMNYEVGRSLQQVLKEKKPLSEKVLISLLGPLMNGLEMMHEKGFIHRDIKPGNIFIREDGSPVLLDFGSARQTRGRDVAQTLTNFVSPGYAPIEQYTSKSDRQGPWTDIYGLGATLYKAIIGTSPTNAMDRNEMLMNGKTDDYQSISKLAKGRYSDRLLAAIDHALAFNVQDRPSSIAEWRQELDLDEEDIETMPAALAREKTTAAAGQDKDGSAGPNGVSRETTTVNLFSQVTQTCSTVVARTRHWLSPIIRHKAGVISLIAVVVVAAVLSILLLDESAQWYLIRSSMKAGETEAVTTTETSKPRSAAAAEQAQADPVPETAAVHQTDETEQDPALPDEEVRPDDRIEGLLSQADADIKAFRLMTPAGNNAYEKYQEVLQMQPDNMAAQRGFRRIANSYVRLAYGAMESGKLQRAEHYLDNAETVAPGTSGIRQARNDLASARREEPPSTAEKLFDDVKAWFKNTATQDEPVEKESSSSERVKKALGGR